MSADAYPVSTHTPGFEDQRFTFGLASDIADVLAAHGYPRPATGADWVELQAALFTLLHHPRRRP